MLRGAALVCNTPAHRRVRRLLKSTANWEVAYGGTLVAEEVLDVMQRDWMRGENALNRP